MYELGFNERNLHPLKNPLTQRPAGIEGADHGRGGPLPQFSTVSPSLYASPFWAIPTESMVGVVEKRPAVGLTESGLPRLTWVVDRIEPNSRIYLLDEAPDG